MNYAKHTSTKSTPQTSPIPGTTQVPNSAGGFVWAVDDWVRLDRFLVLGSEGGSYYAGERELTLENATAVERLLKVDGPRVVARAAEISDAGRAPKNDPAIFVLALALKRGDPATRAAAKAAVPKVCRIGTHIFQLAEAVKHLGGWGRGTKAAFANWYLSQTPDALALNLVKYQSRGGWSHRDLLRKAHVNPKAALKSWVATHEPFAGVDAPARASETVSQVDAAFRWAVGKNQIENVPRPAIIDAFERAKIIAGGAEALAGVGTIGASVASRAPQIMAKLIAETGLPRECVPTEYLNDVGVWDALLRAGKHGMPMTAMIRNLGKMTNVGLLKPLSEAMRLVCERLRTGEALRAARVHPMQVLLALKTYCDGHGDKGSPSWEVAPELVEALNDAFYLAMQQVEPTGKRFLLALDVSGSMASGRVAGSSLTPRDASAALALVMARTEKRYEMVAFTSAPAPARAPGRFGYAAALQNTQFGGENALVRLPGIGPSTYLPAAIHAVSNLPFGGTDCSLPMLYAQKNKLEVDAFVILTDSETYAGTPHPAQALRDYRQSSGIDAKLIVLAMVSNGFSIADPNDRGMLDCVGMDSATPTVIADFVRGA